MKKTLLVIGGVIIIGVVAFFAIKANEAKAPTAMVSGAGATVTPLSSDVSIKGQNDGDFKVIADAASTTVGATVKTSSSGRALIESPFSHPTAIDYSSQVVIADSDPDAKKSTLELVSGSLWARAKNTVEQGDFYQVKTGNAVAVVHGTSFGITYYGTSTIMVVANGEVDLYKRDSSTGEAIPSSMIIVDAGQRGEVDGDGNPVLGALTLSDTQEPWFAENTGADGTAASLKALMNAAPSPSMTAIASPIVSPKPTARPSPTIKPTAVPTRTVTIPPSSSGGGAVTPVSVSSVSPKVVTPGMLVTMKGIGFNRVNELVMNENVPPDFSVIDDATIQFEVDKLSPGTYDLDLILSDDSDVNVPRALTVR